jgi:hypothetical protein
MTPARPASDRDHDVIVRRIPTRDERDGMTRDRWGIFLGSAKRAEIEDLRAALVFARLLADLYKRPVWVCHEDGRLVAADTSSIAGCSCC